MDEDTQTTLSRRSFLATGSALLAAAALSGTRLNAQTPSADEVAKAEHDRSATNAGPENAPPAAENPSSLMPPPTDHGDFPPFWYSFSLAHRRVQEGGWACQVNVKDLPVSKEIAGVSMRLVSGGVRELHWHPNADDWQYYIQGSGRMTLFMTGGKARTMNFNAGDVGVVPKTMGHYIENAGTTDLIFQEMFKSDHYQDFLLSEWISHTPPALVMQHLNLSRETLAAVPKEKPIVVPG